MNPDDTQHRPSLFVPQRQIVPPPTSSGDPNAARSQAAAANIARDQIDRIYNKQGTDTPQSTTESTNPYDQTLSAVAPRTDNNLWQRYHSAWQDYYQQYYERYYAGQVHQAQQALAASGGTVEEAGPMSKDEAMYDLKSKLLDTVDSRTQKIVKSRHFLPIMAALVVLLVFLFLQYNRVAFAAIEAYVAPGSVEPQNLIVDPNGPGEIDPEPKLIIPKITVDVPIVWDAVAADQNSLNNAMNHGVAWFNIPGASSRPGQVGNSVFSGHSSNDWLDGGNYKFIFARLEQMQVGDTIYINYNSTRYVYTVTRKQVVKPTDVAALVFPTDKPIITLVTCVPLGSDANRLLVFADQISPDPQTAESKPAETSSASQATAMPSNSPTFFERILGGRN